MPKKPTSSKAPAATRRRAKIELRDFRAKHARRPLMAELYREAEAQLRQQKPKSKSKPAAAGARPTEADTQRLLHELQVHHVELEMQNAELQETRDRMEGLVEKYTDLYDFAPVGYLSLDDQGQILEVNLSGAALLGVGRAELLRRRLPGFVTSASRPVFLAFLKRVFSGAGKQVCEVTLLRPNGTAFWADFHGTAAISTGGPRKWCRVVVSDVTVLKRAEEAQRRADAIEAANQELHAEIARRKVIEETLRKSEQHQRLLLDQSRLMQEELRFLSRQVLLAQEEERQKISRELHDVIAQTLTGINIRLAALRNEAGLNSKNLNRSIAQTQKIVARSVHSVHEFARELRPAVLDDLGLIPALHSFVKIFSKRTRIYVAMRAFAGVEVLDIAKRTVLYRVAQEALTNVARHAHATRVELSLEKLPAGVALKIKDNGQSFSVDRTLRANHGKRLGLLGMRERLEMVGGTFQIESAVDQGTTITAQIPLGKAGGGGGRKTRC